MEHRLLLHCTKFHVKLPWRGQGVTVDRKLAFPAKPSPSTRVLFSPTIESEGHQHVVVSACEHNELHAIVQRHYIRQAPVGQGWLARAKNILKPLLRHCMARLQSPMSLEEVAASRPSVKRKRYRNAMGMPLQLPPRYKAFVKVEKTATDKLMAGKPPRLIQYADTRYTMECQRYILPIEHAVYSYTERGVHVFAKGKDLYQRARDLLQLRGDHYYECDHSKFDSAVQAVHIDLEWWFYCQLFKQLRPLKPPDKLKIYTRHGFVIQAEGRRKSGDPHTALGNSIINYVVLKMACPQGSLYIDGDDSVVAAPRGVTFDASMTAFSGFTSTVELRQCIEDVSFCQSKIVSSPFGPQLVREPARALARLALVQGVNSEAELKARKQQMLLCEAICGAGVPIFGALGPLVETRRINSSLLEAENYARGGHVFKHQRRLGATITPTARASFARAFGISPSRQLEIEQSLCRQLSAPIQGGV